jgi:hypothetical protein
MSTPSLSLRQWFEQNFGRLRDVLAELKTRTDFPIALIGTPPPKGNNEQLRNLLSTAPGFVPDDQIAHVRLTPPLIMLKLWHILQEVYQEESEEAGVEFISLIDVVRDEYGFLKEEYWADLTHANNSYGRLMLSYLSQKLRTSRV